MPDRIGPTVSIVIPTRNRRESLRRALAGLRSEGGFHELIVTDDGSTDGTAEMVTALAEGWPELKLAATPGLGTHAARVAGVGLATGEVLLFFDDDQVPLPGLVRGHARHHAAEAGIVVSGYYPTVLRRGALAADRLNARWYEEEVASIEANPALGLRHLWGGNLSMRRADIDRVGLANAGFDPTARHADRELGLRCEKAGLGFVFDRSLRAEHHASRSLAEARHEARRSGRGAVLIHHLHPDLAGPLVRLLGTRRRWLASTLRLTDSPAGYRTLTAAIAPPALFSERAAQLLLRIEHRRGALACLAELESAAVGTAPRVIAPVSAIVEQPSA